MLWKESSVLASRVSIQFPRKRRNPYILCHWKYGKRNRLSQSTITVLGMFTYEFRHNSHHSLLPNIFVAVPPIVAHHSLQEFLILPVEWLVSLELGDWVFFWNDARLKLNKGWRKCVFVYRLWADTTWRGQTLRYFRQESNTVNANERWVRNLSENRICIW